MKKLLLTLSIPLLLLCSAYSQGHQYEQLLEQAFDYLIQEDLDNFEKTYIQLYPEYVKTIHPDYYSAVEAAELADATTTVEYLKELIDDDYFLDEIDTDPNFNIIHGTPEWIDFLKFLEEKKSGYDNDLRIELRDIQYRDQGIRMLLMRPLESREIAIAVHNMMQEIDNDSAERICAILDKHGWLGDEIIGTEGNQTLFLAIQHVNDLTVQEKYMPMLREAVELGNAEPWHLAFLTDRILMNQGKKQVYGTQKIIRNDLGKQFIVPLEDPANVDKLRGEMGLNTLAEAMADEGWPWDMEEYLQTEEEIEVMYREWYELTRVK